MSSLWGKTGVVLGSDGDQKTIKTDIPLQAQFDSHESFWISIEYVKDTGLQILWKAVFIAETWTPLQTLARISKTYARLWREAESGPDVSNRDDCLSSFRSTNTRKYLYTRFRAPKCHLSSCSAAQATIVLLVVDLAVFVYSYSSVASKVLCQWASFLNLY